MWRCIWFRFFQGLPLTLFAASGLPATNVYLVEVPDYGWYAGCFGTGCGNLIGYWDRRGFPDFYTGPTNNGLAPLDDTGDHAGIRALWASKAGFDGRPTGRFGHIDDYWSSYENDNAMSFESTDPDPYRLAGRSEHPPDCIGDFIGLSQQKWINLNGECDGNIDGFSFVYWDLSGAKRVNYVPSAEAGTPARDIQSGLREWTNHRGCDAEVFSQLADFNPWTPPGQGFTFDHLRAEIDAGYPVLLFLQEFDQRSRRLGSMDRANPSIHALLAYGYHVTADGERFVRYRTSWASGDNRLHRWDAEPWETDLPVRGVIGYHPRPRLTSIHLANGRLTLRWHGPSSRAFQVENQTPHPVHAFVVQRAVAAEPQRFTPAAPPTDLFEITLQECCEESSFFRVELVTLRFSPP